MTTSPSDPLYTVTIFFIDGTKTVVFCDGFEQLDGGQWLQLVSGDHPITTSTHYNVELIDRWISRDYESSDAEHAVPLAAEHKILATPREVKNHPNAPTPPPKERGRSIDDATPEEWDEASKKALAGVKRVTKLVPPPNETLSDTPPPPPKNTALPGTQARILAGERLVLGKLDRMVHGRDAAPLPAMIDLAAAWEADLSRIVALEAEERKWISAYSKQVGEIGALEVENKRVTGDGWYQDVLNLREKVTALEAEKQKLFGAAKMREEHITDLERARDSADKERESFAVRKAKDADELRQTITALRQTITALETAAVTQARAEPLGDTGPYPGDSLFDHG